ncbi:BTB/POZ domain-containing protein POB1 [Acorus gramineus]|uniref:BTB/POZ domain-containing protein POB1 n=1 Tax=Acorus gramineus TaxID=55184 RepID=A0AAV9AGU2_ACOGR|nr:BTB/POZ domain-containing protein POB1 [Acorus gramineus]
MSVDSVLGKTHSKSEPLKLDENVSSYSYNFEFAFNNPSFSDRLLRVITSAQEPDNPMVECIHVSSVILAAASPFFLKLLSNGMLETDEQNEITLRIDVSEKDALIELLKFIYGKKLPPAIVASIPSLVDILMVADKYNVPSCVQHCTCLLLKLNMNLDGASYCLELFTNVSVSQAIKPVAEVTQEFLVARYKKNILKLQEEVDQLPLSSFEAVLCSDELNLTEDEAYYIVLKWARARYLRMEDRHEVLNLNLARFVRVRYMTHKKLREVLECEDLDHDIASELVVDALFFKAENPPLTTRALTSQELTGPLVRVVEFRKPNKKASVYLELKRSDCQNSSLNGLIMSQAFFVHGQAFHIVAQRCSEEMQSFGLFLSCVYDGTPTMVKVDFEFWVRERSTDTFVNKFKESYGFTNRLGRGTRNLCSMTWASFIGNDSSYFINDVLHLKANISIKLE